MNTLILIILLKSLHFSLLDCKTIEDWTLKNNITNEDIPDASVECTGDGELDFETLHNGNIFEYGSLWCEVQFLMPNR